jgi:ubiquinone biosynthesis accessory factor UbiJ
MPFNRRPTGLRRQVNRNEPKPRRESGARANPEFWTIRQAGWVLYKASAVKVTAYNEAMLHSFQAHLRTLLEPALAERLTLLFNHVLSREAVATQRLQAFSGQRLRLVLEGWPALLPAPPALHWQISPAGLLEWCGVPAAGPRASAPPAATDPSAPAQPEPIAFDLTLRVDASNPAALFMRGLTGTPPNVQVEGNAQLAGEVNWLMQNLRWDMAADLEALFGPGVAHALQQGGATLKEGVRQAMATAGQLGERLRAWRA